MACCGAQGNGGYDKPVRTCTDVCWLTVFLAFIVGMVFIATFAYVYGNPQRLIYGYDSFGNVCGFQNDPLNNVSNSGQNLTDQRYLFFFNLYDLEHSLKICVHKCPDWQLDTYADLEKFYLTTGSQLCYYNLKNSTYNPDVSRSDWQHWSCPNLPVYPSSPVLNRCIPRAITELPQNIIYNIHGYLNNVDLLQQITSDIYSSSKELVILAAVACVLSATLILTIHLLVKWIFCIIATVVSLACIVITSVLWWTYVDLKQQLDAIQMDELLEEMVRNERAFLTYSIGATIVTVILLILMLCMRKNMPAITKLFEESGNCMLELPCLFFLPFWTMIVLFLYFVFWISVIMCLATAFHPSKEEIVLPGKNSSSATSLVFQGISFLSIEYINPSWVRYMWWYYAIALIWVSEFILACQQLVMAGAIANWYFAPDRDALVCPIWKSIVNLIAYHMGSVAKGAFLITICKIPRIILTYLQTWLQKSKENKCTKCCTACCCCCLCCFEKFLKYISHNAYTVVALDGCNFCPAAEEAFESIVKNSILVATLNSAGDFVLFLGKVLVTALTGIIGLLVMKNNPNLHFYAIPIFISCILAFFIAHCVLSLYEMIVDVLTLCYCENSDLAPSTLRASFCKVEENEINDFEMRDLNDDDIY